MLGVFFPSRMWICRGVCVCGLAFPYRQARDSLCLLSLVAVSKLCAPPAPPLSASSLPQPPSFSVPITNPLFLCVRLFGIWLRVLHHRLISSCGPPTEAVGGKPFRRGHTIPRLARQPRDKSLRCWERRKGRGTGATGGLAELPLHQPPGLAQT